MSDPTDTGSRDIKVSGIQGISASRGRMTANEEIVRCFATIREMIVDRGLDSSSFDTDEQLEMKSIFDRSHSNVFEVDIRSAKLRVIMNLYSKYKGTEINKLRKPPVGIDDDLKDEEEKDDGSWQYMIVTRELPVQGKSSSLDDNTQIFKIEELLINVSKHSLVPKHVPIRDPEEIKRIIKAYNANTPQQFPLILSTDPQARYLALKPGELVRIERPSPSNGSYQLYRCCQRA